MAQQPRQRGTVGEREVASEEVCSPRVVIGGLFIVVQLLLTGAVTLLHSTIRDLQKETNILPALEERTGRVEEVYEHLHDLERRVSQLEFGDSK